MDTTEASSKVAPEGQPLIDSPVDGLQYVLQHDATKAAVLMALLVLFDVVDEKQKYQTWKVELGKKLSETLKLDIGAVEWDHHAASIKPGKRDILLGEITYRRLVDSGRDNIDLGSTTRSTRITETLTGQGKVDNSDLASLRNAPITISIDSEALYFNPDYNLSQIAKDGFRSFVFDSMLEPTIVASGVTTLEYFSRINENYPHPRDNKISRRVFLKSVTAGIGLLATNKLAKILHNLLPDSLTEQNTRDLIKEAKRMMPYMKDFTDWRNLVMWQNVRSLEGIEFRNSGIKNPRLNFFTGGAHIGIVEIARDPQGAEMVLRQKISDGLDIMIRGHQALKNNPSTKQLEIDEFYEYAYHWIRLFAPVSIKTNFDSDISFDSSKLKGNKNALLVFFEELSRKMERNQDINARWLFSYILPYLIGSLDSPDRIPYPLALRINQVVTLDTARIETPIRYDPNDECIRLPRVDADGKFVGEFEIFHNLGHVTYMST